MAASFLASEKKATEERPGLMAHTGSTSPQQPPTSREVANTFLETTNAWFCQQDQLLDSTQPT